MKTINNDLIRSFRPCYDPATKNIPEDETLTVIDWVNKYRPTVPAGDIIWLLCRSAFLSDRDLRLFAVWCAREALKLVDNPDPRSIEACNVAERYANGEATAEELRAAYADAAAAAYAARAAYDAEAAAYAAAAYAARATYDDTYAAEAAAYYAAREKQLDQILTYFVDETV